VGTDADPEWMSYEPPTEAFEFAEVIEEERPSAKGREAAAPSQVCV